MKFIVVAVIFAVCATCTHAVVYKDCGSKAKDLKMTISGCSDADPACPFVTGQNVTLQAEFTSDLPIESATIQLAGVIGIVKIPFPLNPNEACGNWGLVCPAAAGARHTLKVALPIQSSYPKIKVGVLMQLVTKGQKLICTSFPVQIKSPSRL